MNQCVAILSTIVRGIAFCYYNGCQQFAPSESRLSNTCDTVWDYNPSEATTTRESFFSNICYTVRKFDTCKTATITKYIMLLRRYIFFSTLLSLLLGLSMGDSNRIIPPESISNTCIISTFIGT